MNFRTSVVALLLMLTSLPAADAPVPVYVNAGPMLCGAILRSGNQVQTWCWFARPYTAATLGYNAVLTLPPGGGQVIAPYNYGTDIITWKFKLVEAFLSYEVTANGAAIRTGYLSAAPPPVVISVVGAPEGSLPSATCGQPWSATLSATGGAGSFTWELEGLPDWIAVEQNRNSANSEIVLSGTPACTVDGAAQAPNIILAAR